ncbi:hypothetical protein [Psychroserpens algicola]|uniref:Uncharacterized protein n=1 Tax=Psychroserpens algicola TaxID=1719034 RepID=A0ABT0HD24_9FLAO|nr:hypothetical protein [Psychroserpens algicola]MCK8482250.1 hypothetical protein [Psychroserpens algicola]
MNAANFENIIYIISIGIPIALFVLFRNYLNDKRKYLPILVIALAIAILGIFLTLNQIGENGLFVFFIVPLLSIVSYRIMFYFFMKKLNREPIDTFGKKSKAMFWDRLFNIAFFPIGLFLPILFVFVLRSQIA